MSQPILPKPLAIAPLAYGFDVHKMPTALDLGLKYDDSVLRQSGGRKTANRTLASFLSERGEQYRFEMSSPITAENACSRLSPYLAFGTISMREIAHATWRRQIELKHQKARAVGKWRGSMSSFMGRLHWHCHFMQKLEDEPRLEHQNIHPGYNSLRESAESDEARLAAWQKGETGLPFVDACMRFLAAKGWLNFRMRAMLMATSSYHLWLHWRMPGLHLARQFVDYEPGIHWPQVQMQSGTTGINTVRIYNPIKQGHDQDPEGAFVRRWVPELADIKGGAIHEPWKTPLAASLLDKCYPMPIVDHLQSAREARQKIYSIRKHAGFRLEASAILEKHGSRKSQGQVARRKKRASQSKRAHDQMADQLSLNFEPDLSEKRRVDS
ncbi:MAG: FAD-binding domain-containing protein [Hyphomicrobiales bacterium]